MISSMRILHSVAMFLPFIILRKNEKRKMKTSTRLTKENPKQRPRVPPMFATNVVKDITWYEKENNKDHHIIGITYQRYTPHLFGTLRGTANQSRRWSWPGFSRRTSTTAPWTFQGHLCSCWDFQRSGKVKVGRRDSFEGFGRWRDRAEDIVRPEEISVDRISSSLDCRTCPAFLSIWGLRMNWGTCYWGNCRTRPTQGYLVLCRRTSSFFGKSQPTHQPV